MTHTQAIPTSPHVPFEKTESAVQELKKKGKNYLLLLLVLVILLVLAAISTPNLLRSRVAANEAAAVGSIRTLNTAVNNATNKQTSNVTQANDRKVKRVATMNIIAKDPTAVIAKIESIVAGYRGILVNQEVRTFESNARAGSITIKIPESQFFPAWNALHNVADTVEEEKIEATDVTSEMVDLESRIRNDRSEEQQYLEIMKRAGSIKDILSVTEKMSEVRGRIEEAQGQLQLMKSQTEMSSIVIGFRMPSVAIARGVNWTPQQHVQETWVSFKQSLADYADFVVSILFYLPVIALWTITILVPLYGLIKLIRWIKPRVADLSWSNEKVEQETRTT